MRLPPLPALRDPLPCSFVLAALLAGCGGAEASNLAEAVVDTLPGGIQRVTSSGPTAWSDSGGITLTEEARWSGEDGTTSEIGQPRSLAVDEAGRVYIVDTKPALIKVFTPDGDLIRTIGGEGEGPGEFRAGFIAVRGGSLVLLGRRPDRPAAADLHPDHGAAPARGDPSGNSVRSMEPGRGRARYPLGAVPEVRKVLDRYGQGPRRQGEGLDEHRRPISSFAHPYPASRQRPGVRLER